MRFISLILPEGSVSRILYNEKIIWEKNPLPAGYTQLDYIETTGKQYIDTGFVPNHNTRTVMDFASTRNDVENFIFGSRYLSTSRIFTFLANDSGLWRFGYNNSNYTAGTRDTLRHMVDINKNVISIDGEQRYTAPEAEFTAPYTMHVGAIKASNKMYYSYAKIYFCQIYDNGILVRDLVPCRNTDGIAGMYDRLSGVFYQNAGTDHFLTV